MSSVKIVFRARKTGDFHRAIVNFLFYKGAVFLNSTPAAVIFHWHP